VNSLLPCSKSDSSSTRSCGRQQEEPKQTDRSQGQLFRRGDISTETSNGNKSPAAAGPIPWRLRQDSWLEVGILFSFGRE
jgi:hypothetical protein